MEFNELKTQLQGVTLGPLSITEVTEDPSFPNTQDITSVNCSLELGGTSFLLTSIFEASEQWLLLSMGANDTFSLTHLTALLGNDFNQSLPDELKTLLDIKLLKFEILTQLDNAPSLEQVNIELDTANPWKIIGDKLAVDQISLGITWFPKLSYTAFDLSGELELAGSKFSIHAITPHFNVWGRLNEDEMIQIGHFFHQLGYDAIDINEFTITNLDFALNQLGAAYRFGMSISEHLTLIPDRLILEDLYLKINKSYEFSVELSASLNLYNDTTIIVSALSSSSAGWQFEGSTGTGQKIPIGTLIEDLARTFDVTQEFPSAIEDLVIENLTTSFNTKTKDFTFTCEAKFPIEGKEVDITVTINITKQLDDSYNKHFEGHIIIGDLQFALIFDTDKTSKTFLAAYRDTNDNDISVKNLIGSISSTLKDEIPGGLTISLKDALFAYYKETQTNFLLGLDIGSGINLSKLPLVGKEFPPNQTIKLAYQVLVTKADFSQTEIAHLNTLYPEGGISLPEKSLTNRLDLATSMRLGSETRQLSLPIAINQNSGQLEENSQPESTAPSSADTTSPDGTKWFQLQKSFGPAHFERIGLKYQDQKIWFLLDVALSAADLTLSLDGLSVNSPLTEFKPEFNLKGIGIDYQSGSALEIGGAFLRKQITKDGKTVDEYDGAAVIKSETFTLSAIGSYTQDAQGDPSLFIYAVLDQPIGGPSFFFVTGLAAGFGYNRALKIPTIDQVATFPLVEEAINSNQINQSSNTQDGATKLTQELNKLQEYIPPETGQIFLAVGVKFTSFKIIDSFALLTVAFGNRFEVNLLGLSTLVAPPEVDKTPVAEVQLALKATFLPDEGFLEVRGQLTPNSYILSKKCHLTGGFAFYSWFAPSEHDGDFVFTLGGYHPEFKVPAHYPKVPRLAFNWQVNSQLNIKADGYFAITASALMAGGHLQAIWESGRLKAWFKAGADFLIAWKPYHYDARIYVDMGVSYSFHILFGTVHISVDVGADLHIWGPEFTGKAHIHLWCVSFTVSFGASASQTPQAIEWDKFKSSFLPADSDICSVAVKDGLVRKINQDDKSDLGVINPKHLCLVTNSVIPATQAEIAGQTTPILSKTNHIIYYEDENYTKIKPFRSPYVDKNNTIEEIKAFMDNYSIAYEANDSKDDLLNKIEEATEQNPIPIESEKSNYPKAIASPGIGSMAVKSGELTSTTTITITRDGRPAEKEFAYIPILKKAPTGLWGESLTPDLNGEQFIENTLFGFEIKPKKQPDPGETHAIDRQNLKFTTESVNDAYEWEDIQPFIADTQKETKQTINDTIIAKSDNRNNLLINLGITSSEIEKIKLSQSIDNDIDNDLVNGFLISPTIEKVPA